MEDVAIDYALSQLEISWVYYLISTVIIIVLSVRKRWTLGLLSGYIFLMLSATIISRIPTETACYELMPFWSYAVPELREEIIWNVIAFIPIGLLAGKLWNWNGILIGAGLSAFIEVIQLITHRGLFEFDDIIHNTAGTIIGVVAIILLKRLFKSDRMQ